MEDHVWIFENSHYPCDIGDCDCYEKVDSALIRLSEELSHIEFDNGDRDSIIKAGEKLRKNCEVILEFFSSVFSTEDAVHICGERMNLLSYSGALASFLVYIENEIDIMAKSSEELMKLLENRLGALAL